MELTSKQLEISVRLTIKELAAMCTVIKSVSKRGAFEIEEYQSVGLLYSMLMQVMSEAVSSSESE